MYFDRFDIREAYYIFFVQYHEGQGSEKYDRLSHLLTYFKPRPGLHSERDLTENGQEIYQRLVAEETSIADRMTIRATRSTL